MADLRLTVRNLFCYPCDLSFCDEDSFRNHHNSRHTIPFNSSLIDGKIETDDHAESDEIEFSSPTKNSKRSKKMDMKNSIHNTENKSIKIKSNSKRKEKKNDSVLKISNKINLSKYKDYIHCCKCFSTFYTLPDLIKHFDKCNVKQNENESDNFKDFKQQKSHSSSHQLNVTTKITTTTEDEEKQLLSNDFMNQDISLSPFTHDNYTNDEEEEHEEEKNTTKNDYYCSTSENVNVDSSPQNVKDQNEDSCDNEIKSESGSEFEPEPEIVESESEIKEEKVKARRKNSKGKFQQQQKKKQGEKQEKLAFKCPVESCSSLSFPRLSSFLQHKRLAHNFNETKNTLVLCSTCGKSVASQFDLLCHMNEHTGYKHYKCNFESCEQSFTIRTKYQKHLYKIHKTRKDLVKCPDKTGCDKAFLNSTELKKHLRNCHAGSIFYKCRNCDEGFLTNEDRYNHHLKVHGEYKYKCEVENCGKIFKTTVGLKQHGVTHQSERPFECDFPGCGGKYKEKSSLRSHKKIIHENKEQCLCPECGKSFRAFCHYRTHLLTHNQEKTYICQYCGRGFSQPTALKAHTLIHSDEKQRKCQFCDKSFRGWSAHKRHEQTHTKINPYKCAFCDAVFPDNRPLKKHVAAAHADLEFDLNIPSTYQLAKPSGSLHPIPIPETVEEPGQNM